MAKPIPEGYHAVTPYLIVNDAAKVIEFYKRGLGAQELMRMPGPGGRIMHAEVKIGDSVIMLGEEPPDKPTMRSPRSAGTRTASLYVYVSDVDTTFKRALDAGAKAVSPVTDMFWGDRMGTIEDPSGHHVSLATHKEDVSPEEIGRRHQQFVASMSAPKKT
jgi:PhnB protein